jgi:hypothetical protein
MCRLNVVLLSGAVVEEKYWSRKSITLGFANVNICATSSAHGGTDVEQWLVVQRCEACFPTIEEVAFENGMGTVRKVRREGKHLLVITGLDVEFIKACVQSLFFPPSKYLPIKECEYGERVMSLISDQTILGQPTIAKSTRPKYNFTNRINVTKTTTGPCATIRIFATATSESTIATPSSTIDTTI